VAGSSTLVAVPPVLLDALVEHDGRGDQHHRQQEVGGHGVGRQPGQHRDPAQQRLREHPERQRPGHRLHERRVRPGAADLDEHRHRGGEHHEGEQAVAELDQLVPALPLGAEGGREVRAVAPGPVRAAETRARDADDAAGEHDRHVGDERREGEAAQPPLRRGPRR
jgi:hypothetical protein